MVHENLKIILFSNNTILPNSLKPLEKASQTIVRFLTWWKKIKSHVIMRKVEEIQIQLKYSWILYHTKGIILGAEGL